MLKTMTGKFPWLIGLGRTIGICILCVSSSSYAQESPDGSAIYGRTCAQCHGVDGRGGQLGPAIMLRTTEDTDTELGDFLLRGNPERGMPPAVVTEAELQQLIRHMRLLTEAARTAPVEQLADAADATTTLRTVENFVPIDDATLLNPDPNDWISFSRTQDAQRFSPLDQINSSNVDQLELAWVRGLPEGLTYNIPLVYNGVLYLATPASTVMALDATNGDLIWEYKRPYANAAMGRQGRSKTISMYADMVYFTAPDATVVALDAKTGALRWEADAGERGHTGGTIVAKGKVISSGNCIRGPRDNCFISAHDALTGELLWKFNTIQVPGPDGVDTWAGVPIEDRLASPWGLPGSYDPVTDLIYWGIANPMPSSRLERHNGNPDATGVSAPADLYSNSTVALDPDTGELVWYYQHLPGDDWDLDMNEERTLLTTTINPDPAHVRWINPNIERGSTREVVVNVGEGGGLWMLDRHTGEFIWATPFPFNVDNFFLSDIDVNTGITHINQALLMDEPGERTVVCYLNTRSFWPTSYHPGKNALYVPYIRNCLDMTAPTPGVNGARGTPERRVGIPEEGVPLDELNGLARVDLETGAITHWPMGRIPTNSAILATAGNVVFWGDLNRRYRAMDADTGAVLWETVLAGPVSVSNITYAVDGVQYVAVVAGETLAQQGLTAGTMGPIQIDLGESTGQASLFVFALPQQAP